jgi:hypothetical protein
MRNNYFKNITVNYVIFKFILAVIPLLFLSCESSIKADFDTIRAKKVILLSDEGKEFRLKIIKDPSGIERLDIEPVNK